MDAVCQECGDVGISELLLHCSNCKNASRHRYCFPTVLFESVVEWLCIDCLPKTNEAIESTEDVSNQRPIRGTQVGSTIVNELNVKEKEVTKGLWSWGYRKNRSRARKKDHNDASTKNFISGDTVYLGHCVNRPRKARSNSSDSSTKKFESRDTLNSREISSSEVFRSSYSEKKGKDKKGICAVDVDGSSHPALEHAYETGQYNHFQDSIGKRTLNSMQCPDLLKKNDNCFSSSEYIEGSIPQGREVDILSLVNDVELSHPTLAEKLDPTLASVEQPNCCSTAFKSIEKTHHFKEVQGFPYKKKSILTSKIPQNHSNPMQGSDRMTGNTEVLNPSKECFDSLSKVSESSSPSNEREEAVKKEGTERIKHLAYDELAIGTLENYTGSNPSMVKDCMVYNAGSPDETNGRPAETLLSTKHMKIQKRMSGEDYHICNGPSERGNSWRGIETSYLKSGEGHQNGRNLKNNVGKTSSSACKKLPHGHVLQLGSINDDLLSSMYVSPCESTKVNPRRPHNQSGSYPPHETKYQKTDFIMNKNVCTAQSKSGRTATSLKDKSLLLKSSCARTVTKVDHMEPSRRPDHTISHAFSKTSLKTTVHGANDVQPKKQRHIILSNHEVEDTVIQAEDQTRSMPNIVNKKIRYVEKNKEVLRRGNLNCRSSKNYKQVKEHRSIKANKDKNRHAKKQRFIEKVEKAPCLRNLRHQSSKYRKQVKKKRSVEATQNQKAVAGYLDAGCANNAASVLPSQTVFAEDHCALSKMPVISEHICAQPIDKPYWTGIMKIGRDYIPLAAHLSSKAGKTVQELLRSLPPIMKVTEQASPKHLEALKPRADSILLYFFSGDTRPNKELDQLVKHVADSTVVLETAVGLAKLLLSPSVVLPEEYQTYQGKHYLWGVFEQINIKARTLAAAKQHCMTHVTGEEEPHVLGEQDKPQGVTLDHEMPLADQAAHCENEPVLDANQDIGKESLAGNGAPCASSIRNYQSC